MKKRIKKEVLLEALGRLGWTQSFLAKELGVSSQSVTNWLQGAGFPHPSKLLKLTTSLGLPFEDLVDVIDDNKPVVAFRKKANAKTTKAHIDKATEIGLLLRPLVQYLPAAHALRTLITSPSTEYEKLQLAALEARERLGVGDQATLDYDQLIGEFESCGAILVPVLLGSKGSHENALHIRLPLEDVTFIFVNLDTKVEDFKFWMAHELAHVYTPLLSGTNAGEDYADAFAGALLFPKPCAQVAYWEISKANSQAEELVVLQEYATKHEISLNTVYQRVIDFAEFSGLPGLKISERSIHMARNSAPGPMVSEVLFDPLPPDLKHYLAASENIFRSCFFQALRKMIVDKDIGPAYLQQVLDLSMIDANALHKELSH